jgi:hypothetical protein
MDYMQLEVTPFLVKDYGDNTPDVKDLTEVYMVVYTVERIGQDPQEIYSFTCDFAKAYKRFKILPHGSALLKRMLTDDEHLIALGLKGDITLDITDDMSTLTIIDTPRADSSQEAEWTLPTGPRDDDGDSCDLCFSQL